MQKIDFILIDENDTHSSLRRPKSDFRHHFVINPEGLVINHVDISESISYIPGPSCDVDQYNKHAIGIRFFGSLRLESWLMDSETTCKAAMRHRKVLVDLLVHLRKQFPDAKILSLSEISGRNIIASDIMNILRTELSEL